MADKNRQMGNSTWAIIICFTLSLLVWVDFLYHLYFDISFFDRYPGRKIGAPLLGATLLVISILALISKIKDSRKKGNKR